MQRSQEPAPIPAGVTTVNLEEFLEPVADDLDLDFLIDVRSRHEIYVGGTGIEDITYPLLLSILRNNQLMAVVIDGRVNIVPESLARMIPVALVNEDDPEVADDEMVSRVIQMNTMSAPQVAPILRPLLPQYSSPGRTSRAERSRNCRPLRECEAADGNRARARQVDRKNARGCGALAMGAPDESATMPSQNPK